MLVVFIKTRKSNKENDTNGRGGKYKGDSNKISKNTRGFSVVILYLVLYIYTMNINQLAGRKNPSLRMRENHTIMLILK